MNAQPSGQPSDQAGVSQVVRQSYDQPSDQQN